MITILLSTYNGEKFLAEQLESLKAQDFSDWKLLARDDASQDRTWEILVRAAAEDSRIELLRHDGKRLGVIQSFAWLLEHAREAPYVFFCDQDDRWQPWKLSQSLELLRRAEGSWGAEMPLAVHSDLSICDEQMNVVQASMKRGSYAEAQDPQPFSRLLAQNFVTGCTLGLNRSLVERSLPIPTDALMHDWWVALVAASLGKILYLPEASVLYRQHGANASGPAAQKGLLGGMAKFFGQRSELVSLMQARFRQSHALERHLARYAPNAALLCLQDFHRAAKAGGFAALRSARRWGIRMEDSARTLMYYALLFG